jgi:hypothetical protein
MAKTKKARKKWMGMSMTARQKAMPAKRKGAFKKYPVGQYMLLNVGKKGKYTHWQYVQKTPYGWRKAKAPKAIRKYEISTGYIKLTPAIAKKMTVSARKKWKSMSKTARKKAMPSWSLARKLKAKAKR